MIVRTESGSIYEIDESRQVAVRINDEYGMRADGEHFGLIQWTHPKMGEPMTMWIQLPGRDFTTVRTTTPVTGVVL